MNTISILDRNNIILIIFALFITFLVKAFIGMKGALILLLVPISLIFIILGSSRWKLSIYLFMLWFIIEGALRKWFLPNYSSHIFLFKYIILLCPLFYFLKQGIRLNKHEYPFYASILIYILWGMFEVLNPVVSSDIKVKVLGVMIHYSFIPLIYIIPQMFSNKDKLFKIIFIIVLISIPIYILGVYQYLSPPYSTINKYVAEGEDLYIASIGGKARITSVFSYISPYTSYLIFSMSCTLMLIFSSMLKGIKYLFVLLSGALGFVNLFMTGSRGAVYSVIIIAIIYLCLLFAFNLYKRNKLILRIIVLAFLLIGISTYSNTMGTSIANFFDRAERVGGVGDRISRNIFPVYLTNQAGLFGMGIGVEYQGAKRFIKNSNTPYVEGEYQKLIVELGLIGLLIVIIMRLHILYYTYKYFKRITDKNLKSVMLLLFIFQIPCVLGQLGIIYSSIQNAIYWMIVGLVVAVYRIDKKVNEAKNYRLSTM
jgi:hypothetical protein